MMQLPGGAGSLIPDGSPPRPYRQIAIQQTRRPAVAVAAGRRRVHTSMVGQRMEISEELQCMGQGDNRRHNYADAGHEHP